MKVDKKAGVGMLNCAVCAQSFQCGANYLSAPIDIYSEWVDAAGKSSTARDGPHISGMARLTRNTDAVAKDEAANNSRAQPSSSRSRPAADRYDDEEDDRRYEGDGIVDDDEY